MGECESLTPLHKSRSRAGSGNNRAVSGTAIVRRFRVRPCQFAETALRLARHRAPQFDGESVKPDAAMYCRWRYVRPAETGGAPTPRGETDTDAGAIKSTAPVTGTGAVQLVE